MICILKPERILYINGGLMDQGGISTFMMNNYRKFDKKKIQVDFVVHGYEKGYYDDEILNNGGKIYNIPPKGKNYIKNILELKKILNPNVYKIVHSQMDAGNLTPLKIAKNNGIPIRISHSHNTNHITSNLAKHKYNDLKKKYISKYATHFFACSMDAGVWLHGKVCMNNINSFIIHNAISLDDFSFSTTNRAKIRRKYDLEGSMVIGHVGRFDYQKNHEFLIDVFSKYHQNNAKSKLVLIGEGRLKSEIINQIKKLNLEDNIVLLGEKNNVGEILSAFDYFIFPSVFEGLGIVLIEAQSNGLPCLISDSVPEEVKITNNVKSVSLTKNSSEWADLIDKFPGKSERNQNNFELLKNAGYDINIEANKLQSFYLDEMIKYSNFHN